MASISQLLAKSAQSWAAKNIAKSAEGEGKKESFFGGLMSLAKPAAGFLAKMGTSALGISNPYLLPLLMGGGTAGISKIFDVIGRKGFKLGADPSKIESTSKYGFGKEHAKTIREGLEESIKKRDPLSQGSIAGDVIGSYISALTPKIVPTKEGGYTVEGGDLGKRITGDIEKWKKGKAAKSLIKARGSVPPLEETFDMPFEDQFGATPQEELLDLFTPSEEWASPRPLSRMDLGLPEKTPLSSSLDWYDAGVPQYDEFGSWTGGTQFRGDRSGVARYLGEQSPFTQKLSEPGLGYPTEEEEEWFQRFIQPEETPFSFERGGQVPKYYGGGSVSGTTIADYFGQQGMTLGGSNKQSLSEMLGKK